jgi:RNA polymerase sigma factor (sigma-70 family)
MANPSREDSEIARLLEGLGTAGRAQAWTQFLEAYWPIILQVVQLFEREPDHRADCFLFVCEQLSNHQFRRLRRFKPHGKARFETWLRAVVRNLCTDWHRKEFGRHRIFKAVAALSALDQEVFRYVYMQGSSKEDCFLHLLASDANLERAQIEESLERLQRVLTPRQLWLLSTRTPGIQPIERESEDDPPSVQRDIPDAAPDPEASWVLKEQQAALERALARLSKPELLLIRMRYDQGLKLTEISEILGLKDAQTVDRRLRDVLEKLRKDLAPFGRGRGKNQAMSV